jgi:NTE family protein
MESVKIISDQSRKTIPAVSADGRPTVAVALGGGGARGAAHIGVLKVFEREGIPVNYIVGNSMGAIVGGLYSSGMTLDSISELLEDGSLRHAYMPTAIVPKVLIAPLSRLSLHPHYAGLFSGKKFTQYLQSVLPKPDMDVSATKIPFSAVATNLIDGKAYTLSDGSLATAMKASSAISPLLQPVAVGDKVFVDGGVRANMPIRAAQETGAGIVIAVLVDEPLVPVPAKRFVHLKGIASRMADIVLAASDERQLEYADVVINPDVSNIPILSKNGEDAVKAIKIGEAAAEKALPAIRRLMQNPPHNHSRVAGKQQEVQ